MKKRKLLLAAWILLGIYLVWDIGSSFFSTATRLFGRYDTIEEAFLKANESNVEIAEVLQADDIALVTYFESDGGFWGKVMAKDSRGWYQLSWLHKNKQKILLKESGGTVYVKELNGKTVIHFHYGEFSSFKEPTVYDSLQSDFLISYGNSEVGFFGCCGLLVFDGPIPDNYTLTIENEQISFE